MLLLNCRVRDYERQPRDFSNVRDIKTIEQGTEEGEL